MKGSRTSAACAPAQHNSAFQHGAMLASHVWTLIPHTAAVGTPVKVYNNDPQARTKTMLQSR